VIARRDVPDAHGVAVEVVPVPLDGFGEHGPEWARGAIADPPVPVSDLGWHHPTSDAPERA
jgi:hypothetical protein